MEEEGEEDKGGRGSERPDEAEANNMQAHEEPSQVTCPRSLFGPRAA